MFADKITLTMSETLFVAVAGVLVVMAELALITVLILGISKILRSIEGKLSGGENEAPEVTVTPVAAPAPVVPAAPAASAVSYGAVNGVFFDEDGNGFAALNSGASERRTGHLALINRDLINWAMKTQRSNG